MEINIGDNLHCEEQLKTTLHCDDKEKLRQKLVLLQREYLKTAQRLQRAERSEAVRRHVRSRIEQQSFQDQKDQEVTSNPPSVTLNGSSRSAAGELQSQELNGSLSDSETSRRSQGIRFLLPSDAATPQTPDSISDSASGHRPTPALRLRSRRSRLRWERRSVAEAERSADHSEGKPEQSEKMEADTAEAGPGQERVQREETEVVNESEELFSSGESGSLLLTHWNTAGQTEAGSMGRKDAQTEKETERGQESTSLQLTYQDSALNSDKREQKNTQNRKIKEKEEEERDTDGGKIDEGPCEDSSENNTERNAAETSKGEKSPDNTPETKEEIRESARAEPDVKAVSLLDSCTLVEGLLFPVEYYVRTTRRMSSSQSQPDMQAIIHTQLGRGRPRRSRGRGRGQNKHISSSEASDKFNQSDFSSPTAASPAEINSQSPSAEALCTPNVCAARSARGRRRRGRGRGRGRSQTPRCSHSLDSGQVPDDLQLSGSPVSAPASLCGADGPKPCPSPKEATATVPDPPQPASTHSTSSQLPPDVEKVFPIFLKSSSKTSRPLEISRSPSNWRSLLLPPPPPAQTSLLPLPSLSSCSLLNSLSGFDVPQDFHLPDDQFASLKLLKLRTAAVESGVEDLTPPSDGTRRSIQHRDAPHSSVTPLPLPLSLTPEITVSSLQTEEDASTQAKDLQNVHDILNKESSNGGNLTGPVQSELQTHVSFTDSAPAVKEVAPHSSQSNTNRGTDHFVKLHISFVDSPAVKVNNDELDELEINESSLILLDDQNDSPCVNHHFENERSTARQTKTGNKAIVKALSFDSPRQKTPKKTVRSLTTHNESPQQQPNVESPEDDRKESPERTTSPPRVPSVRTQLLMSPLLASVPGCVILPSSFTPASPMLPSLGATPAALPLTSSPSAPVLTRPPPHSPSTQNLSPPVLSPCPTSPTFFPPSQPPNSTRPQIQASCERVEPATCPPVPGVQGEVSGVRTEETAEEQTWRCLHTLKAPAGGCLVDACCLMGPSGDLCVAAAGKWAVCLWSQTGASDWSLKHTWAFNEPVINVFPVLDAVGLVCVTLGQLEIREVRMLWCSGLSQELPCEGLVQAVVCVSGSRVVTSSHSSRGSTLQVFTLSDSSSTCSSQPLVSPGVCVGALAPVDGLLDALIGTAEDGCLFIWNLKTGQLLRRVGLTHGLSHTACLRGFSYCGVLFVLLQHHFLSSLEEMDREGTEDPTEDQKKKKSALFSLVAVNPLNGKSALATRLCPPIAWSGRLCETDVSGSSVVGLSQSGCVCVWELGRRGASKMVWCPESDGWQLARWGGGGGGGGTLLMGHHNGDVSLRCCST